MHTAARKGETLQGKQTDKLNVSAQAVLWGNELRPHRIINIDIFQRQQTLFNAVK
jgi:hypothetical protein